MSHYPVVVLVPPDVEKPELKPELEAERLLAPYDEGGEWFADGSRWDWWTVGGRWTGSLDGFDPRTDPANTEMCDLCAGTGTRPDWPEDCTASWIAECNGCNGCHGEGTRLKWNFARHDGDIRPLKSISTEFLPTVVVTPDGEWHEEVRMGWFGAELERKESPGDWGALVSRLYLEHSEAVATTSATGTARTRSGTTRMCARSAGRTARGAWAAARS